MFQHNMLTAQTQSFAWIAIFFIASSAASAAYLTVSELFPLEMRGLAIAIFFAAGTLIGGVAAPWIFASLIQAGREQLAIGYFIGAGLMVFAAVVEAVFGVAAEGKSLESITAPLTSQENVVSLTEH
jgi:MFS family permease